MNVKRIPEAHESNAGDDFHVLWAIRRSFDLLRFDEKGLKVITIEGPLIKEADDLDPSGGNLLGIDIAEYFGYDSFELADRVVFSQLKYSTRNPDVSWTIARICEKKDGDRQKSIIGRLAASFKTYIDGYGRALVLSKLVIKLVSNRPTDKALAYLISCTQAALRIKPTGLTEHKLKQVLTRDHPVEAAQLIDGVDRLSEAANLQSTQLVDFINLLDVSDCGAESRFFQERAVILAINNVTRVDPKGQFSLLYQLINVKTLPENRQHNKIVREDMLLAFGFSSVDSLLPAKAHFDPIKHLIERAQLRSIVERITMSDANKVVCLHGGAGFGKSTISSSLGSYLPSGSVTVVFDAYGGGMYLDPSDQRHEHEWAILQIANELAIQAGSPLLLLNNDRPAVYLRALKQRVQAAVDIVRIVNPSAVICVVFDAADNSVVAAQAGHMRSVVLDLIKERWPDGFKLIVTARTHRLSLLELPAQYTPIELEAFTLEETRQHVLAHLSDASEEEIIEFHELTYGVPRAQAYALASQTKMEAILKPLRPGGKHVEEIIQMHIKTAIDRLGDAPLVTKLLRLIVLLPRPVPLEYVATLASTQADVLIDLATDLWHGLAYLHGQLHFRDEDYGTYLHDHYPASEEDYIAIADLLWIKASTDAYASQHLGNFLLWAKRIDQLQQLVLTKGLLEQPTDPIQNREVFLQRTRLAMQAALASATDQLTYLKLQLVAAEATKTDTILKKTLRAYPQLTVQYGNVRSVQQLYEEPEENNHQENGNDQDSESSNKHFGSLYYQSAAIYARDSTRQQLAEAQLKQADAWRKWVRDQPKESRKKFGFTIDDVIAGLEAYMVLRGVPATVQWFRSWVSIGKYKAYILQTLTENLLAYYSPVQVCDWLAEVPLRASSAIIIFNTLRIYGHQDWLSIPSFVKPFLRLSLNKQELSTDFRQAGINLCEEVARQEGLLDMVLHLLTLFQPAQPDDTIYYFNGMPDQQAQVLLNLYVRGEVLRAVLSDTNLKVSHFYPVDLKDHLAKSDKQQADKRQNERFSDQKRDYDHLYSHMVAFFETRTRFLIERSDEQLFNIEFAEAARKLKGDWNIRYYRKRDFEPFMTFLAHAMLDVLPYYSQPIELVSLFKETFLHEPRNAIRLRLVMADRLSINLLTRPLALQLLTEVTNWLYSGHEVGEIRIETFAEVTLIGQRVDAVTGKAYFDQLIDAASHIDVDAHEQLQCLRRIALPGIPHQNPELAHSFARYAEYCYEQLKGYDGYPWAAVVATLSTLDHSVALAQLCRWDHRDVLPFSSELVILLKVGVNEGWLTHTMVSGLLPLLESYWYQVDEMLSTLIDHYDQQGDASLKVRFAEDLLYDLSTRFRGDASDKVVARLANLPEGPYLNADIRRKLRDFFQYAPGAQGVPEETSAPRVRHGISDEEEATLPWRELAQMVDPFSTTALEDTIRQLTQQVFNFFYKEEGSEFWEIVALRCLPSQYADHLTAFVLINPKLLPIYQFLDLLEIRLNAWQAYPAVGQWKLNMALTVFEHWFLAFRSFGSIHHGYLNTLGRLLDVSSVELPRIISRLIPSVIHRLSATDLYELAEYTCQPLKTTEIEELLVWTLNRWNQVVPDEVGDGPWQEHFMPSGSKDEVIADVLRYLMAHPIKAIRWRAAHAVRRLSRYGHHAVTGYLIEKSNQRQCSPFQHPHYTFFWLSAKLWLWMTIDRIAVDKPQIVQPFTSQILSELNKPGSHVLIQYFIRRAALRLVQIDPSSFTASEHQLVKNALTSQVLPTNDPAINKGYEADEELDQKLTFHFDPIDTLPYWYDSLGDLFGVSSHDIARLADEVIRDDLGFVGDASQENHVHSDDYYDVSNNHGELPKVEDLSTYFEYHAMFYAAGKLLNTVPLIQRPEYQDTWDDWLDKWSTYWPDRWRADLRDPLPNLDQMDLPRSTNSIDDWLAVDIAQMAKRIVFQELNNVGAEVTIYAGWSDDNDNREEAVTLRSAMVSVKTAPALLRALHSVKDHYDYSIPLEDSEREYDNPNFTFIGFVKVMSSKNYKALDKHDDFANDLPDQYVRLGDAFFAWSKAKLSDDFRLTTTPNGIIAHFENWAAVEKSRHRQVGKAGMQLTINKDVLCRYLAANDFCLIIDCHIQRKRKYHEWDDGKEKEFKRTKPTLFLLYPNGTISTLPA